MELLKRFYDGLRYIATGTNSNIEYLESKLKESAKLANVDPLTGLYNMRGFDDLVNRKLSEGLRGDGNFGVQFIYFDLDNFKQTNDTYGHEHGDKALKDFSDILSESSRMTDVVARLGGDEFVHFSTYHDQPHHNIFIVRLTELVARYNLANHNMKLDFSYGTATGTFDPCKDKNGIVAKEMGQFLLNSADTHMYQMKEKKKKGLVTENGAYPNLEILAKA